MFLKIINISIDKPSQRRPSFSNYFSDPLAKDPNLALHLSPLQSRGQQPQVVTPENQEQVLGKTQYKKICGAWSVEREQTEKNLTRGKRRVLRTNFHRYRSFKKEDNDFETKIDPEEIPKFNKIREGIQGIADLEAVITNLMENNENSMRKGEELPRP